MKKIKYSASKEYGIVRNTPEIVRRTDRKMERVKGVEPS